MGGLETERRFLIEMPRVDELCSRPLAKVFHITQTYLLAEEGVTERVRRREGEDGVTYTHTRKRRLSAMTAQEDEEEIGAEEYARLLLRADPALSRIEKTRITLPHGEHLLEIDLYPFWERTALLEVELPREDAPLSLPEYLHILAEITRDGRYRNAAMAKEIPPEAP